MMEPAVAVTLTEDAVVVPVIRALEPKETFLPAERVMVPEYDVTLDETIISFDAPVEVIETLPEPPADTAPFIVTEPKEATIVMLPDDVVTPLVVRLPVAAVYEKAQAITTTFRSVLVADFVTV